MQIQELLQLQTSRGARLASGADVVTRSLDAVLSDCRKYIEEHSEDYKLLTGEPRKNKIQQIIMEFVMESKPLVADFITGDNKPDTIKLIDKLKEEITDYGILAEAMASEDVFEIRGNGKEIKVERKGRVMDLLDASGNVISFQSPEQQDIIMKKLLGDVRLTPMDALVNSRTMEGYRIAAVHSSATGADPDNPAGELYNSFVLRKFKKVKMGLEDIVKFGTMSDNMARTLALLPAGGLTFVTVGPTASGKTTTNNAILITGVPPTTRTVLAQNPSEIDLRFKDPTGRVYNDVLHLEAVDKENPTPKDPTMNNIMDHILRLSPTFVVFGEIRTNAEFETAMKIMLAGHPINTTYHAESASGAVKRYLTAYLASAGNMPSHLALGTLCELLNIIVVQKILRDGTRKVIQITEVCGVEENDPNKPVLNDLFRFEITGEPEYDDEGNVKKINGEHKRVGKLSEKTIHKLKLEGVATSRYDYLMKDVSDSEIETYTGTNISTYGM